MPLVYVTMPSQPNSDLPTQLTALNDTLCVNVDTAHYSLNTQSAFYELYMDTILSKPTLTSCINQPVRFYCLDVTSKNNIMINQALKKRIDDLTKSPETFPKYAQVCERRLDNLVEISLNIREVKIVGCFEFVPWDNEKSSLILNKDYADKKTEELVKVIQQLCNSSTYNKYTPKEKKEAFEILGTKELLVKELQKNKLLWEALQSNPGVLLQLADKLKTVEVKSAVAGMKSI